jgi:hypothetical protein
MFDKSYVLFLSPLMTRKQIEKFINAMTQNDRNMIQHIAINYRTWDACYLDSKFLGKLTRLHHLKEIQLVSEIPSEVFPCLGSTANPQEMVDFDVPQESEHEISQQILPRRVRFWDVQIYLETYRTKK